MRSNTASADKPDVERPPKKQPARKRALWSCRSLRVPGPLERRLFLIVLIGLLPLTLLSFFLLAQDARDQRERLLDVAQNSTSAVMTAIDAELNLTLASLDVLAASSSLQRRHMAAFHHEAQQLMARRAGWFNVVLSTPDARQLVNARLPFGSRLPGQVDPVSVQAVAQTGLPVVGGIRFSELIGDYAFPVMIPIKQNGKVAYVLTSVVKPAAVLQILLRQNLQDGQVMVVTDRSTNVVARSLDHRARVGKPASNELVRLLAKLTDSSNGRLESVTLEGTPVRSVYTRSPATGWTVVLGTPVHTLEGPVRKLYAFLAGATLLSVLIGLAAAFVVGRTLTRPMRELELAAAKLGDGQPPALPHTTLPEFRQIGKSLMTAHVERERRLQIERHARLYEKQAREVAEQASRAKDEFLAMLGHELRNPLAAITAASQLLDLSGLEQHEEAQRDARAIIRRQARHLGKLTDDLLDAGRIILGKIALNRRPVELAIIVERAVAAARNQVHPEQVQLTVHCEPVWVEADPTRIEQVIDNLLGNAIKYSPAPATVSVSLALDAGQVVLRVCDNGVGMEPELQQRVFDLFVQGKRSLDRSQGGLGIGLTLVKRLVELHGGSVRAESAGPGLGSQFEIRLPAIPAPERTDDSFQETRTRPLLIVLVEDNQDLRNSLRQLLELHGHQVLEATDGEAGVKTILSAHPDVALVDIGLPLLDGFSVAQAVRQRQDEPICLIAVSGYGNHDTAQRAADAGFDAYLTKPVDMAALSGVLAARWPLD